MLPRNEHDARFLKDRCCDSAFVADSNVVSIGIFWASASGVTVCAGRRPWGPASSLEQAVNIFVGVSTPSCADEKKPIRDPARTHPRTVNECLSSDLSDATPMGVPPLDGGFSPWRMIITSVGPVMRASLVVDAPEAYYACVLANPCR